MFRVLSRYSAYENALGVKSVSFNKDTSRVLLAVGSYDQKIRILNALTWRAISELSHPSPFTSETAVYHFVLSCPSNVLL
jgi:WD40 repeat protein